MKMAKEKETFETALRRLEEAVTRLEGGDLSLEESLACFEQGVQNAVRCRQLLAAVETRVELLLKDREGGLGTEPFEQ
jgi:exodeoxyribonuclease VII small subunit